MLVLLSAGVPALEEVLQHGHTCTKADCPGASVPTLGATWKREALCESGGGPSAHSAATNCGLLTATCATCREILMF